MKEKKDKTTKKTNNNEVKAINEKQIISKGTAVKGLINGFLSYSLVLGFIFLIISLIILNLFTNYTNGKLNSTLRYTLPLISAIIIFFIIRWVCDLSTFDLFKKCKIKEDDISKVSSYMNLFYILFIIFSLIIVIFTLTSKFDKQKASIELASEEFYSIHSESFADSLVADMIEDFAIGKINSLIYAIILESGIFLGTLSLVKTQKELIKKYN